MLHQMHQAISRQLATFGRLLEAAPEIKYAGDPVLRRPAEEVMTEEGLQIASQLEDVLLRCRKVTGYGRGIAAPQIGLSKAVFITYINDRVEIFMNPLIIATSEMINFYRELCLSAGIVAADVERPEWVVMRYVDRHGVVCEQRAEGFEARLWQHEEAHLRGRLNLDDATEQGIELVGFDPLKEMLRPNR